MLKDRYCVSDGVDASTVARGNSICMPGAQGMLSAKHHAASLTAQTCPWCQGDQAQGSGHPIPGSRAAQKAYTLHLVCSDLGAQQRGAGWVTTVASACMYDALMVTVVTHPAPRFSSHATHATQSVTLTGGPQLWQPHLVGPHADGAHILIDALLQVLAHGVAGHHAHQHVARLRAGVHEAPWADVAHAIVDDHLARHASHLEECVRECARVKCARSQTRE
eukprot:1140985-Pelagomonas_calceolata.AAC.2